MRVATFNANSIRTRLEIVVNWMRDHEPDVLCLQETKAQDRDFPLAELQAYGYHVSFRGQKSYNGVAMISREAPADVRFGFDDGKSPDDTRLMTARFGRVHVINTYVPQGRDIDHEMYAYKQEWFDRLRATFEARYSTRMRVVWVGDLNVAPEPMDIHNADQQANHVCFHEDIQAAFRRARDWGFVDVFRKHKPDAEEYSFFDYRVPGAIDKKRGWRIDHILATRCLAARSTNAFIDLEPRRAERPSDHTFVVAEFDL